MGAEAAVVPANFRVTAVRSRKNVDRRAGRAAFGRTFVEEVVVALSELLSLDASYHQHQRQKRFAAAVGEEGEVVAEGCIGM